MSLIEEYHDMFSCEEGGRGEMDDVVELHIDTGDAHPKSQPPRCVCLLFDKRLHANYDRCRQMVLFKPSKSPWASPIVLVRKDGSLRFCIHYRSLNSVTTQDKFPIPRIDDLLDQLDQAQFFTTLDLAAGYWQIKVDDASREKTAFSSSTQRAV